MKLYLQTDYIFQVIFLSTCNVLYSRSKANNYTVDSSLISSNSYYITFTDIKTKLLIEFVNGMSVEY